MISLDRWQPHSLNPVVRDVRTARPAGRIIVNSHGHIRPGQDCSTRYGAAITLNRILELSPGLLRRALIRPYSPTPHPGCALRRHGWPRNRTRHHPSHRPRLAGPESAKPPPRETVNDTGESLYTCTRAFLPSRINEKVASPGR